MSCPFSCCTTSCVHSVSLLPASYFPTLPHHNPLTPSPIGNRWETLAAGYCQMEQILITASASSVYSLPASPPTCAPVRHLTCSTLISSADMSVWYDFVLLITRYLSYFSPNGKQTSDWSALQDCSHQPVNFLFRLWLLCGNLEFAREVVLHLYSSKIDVAFPYTHNFFECTDPETHDIYVGINFVDVGWEASTCCGKSSVVFVSRWLSLSGSQYKHLIALQTFNLVLWIKLLARRMVVVLLGSITGIFIMSIF